MLANGLNLKSDIWETESMEFKVLILTVESQGFGMQSGKKMRKLSEYGRRDNSEKTTKTAPNRKHCCREETLRGGC